MRLFRLYHPLWMAFYSKRLYRDVGQHWSGRGLSYVLLLVLVASVPHIVHMYVVGKHSAEASAQALEAQLPHIRIEGGEASVTPPGRHVVTDPESGKPLVVVDLDFRLDDLGQMDSVFLLTRTHLIVKTSPDEVRIVELKTFGDGSLTPQQVAGVTLVLFHVALLFVVPFIYLGLAIYRHVQVLIYGAIGLLLSKVARTKLDYRTLVRLSSIAITPSVLLTALRQFSPASVPLWPTISFLIAMGYLYFGIRANAPAPPESAVGASSSR